MNRARLLIAPLLVAGGMALAPLSVAHASDLGGIAFAPSKGTAETLVTLTTERGCVEGAAIVTALMAGPGMPAGGQVIFGPSALELSTTAPMVLPVSNAFVVFAQDNATVLNGKYAVTVQCLDAQGSKVLDTFDSSISWDAPNGSNDAAASRFVAVSNAKGIAGTPNDQADSADGAGTGADGSDQPTGTEGDDVEPDAGVNGQPSSPGQELADGSNPQARPDAAEPTQDAPADGSDPVRVALIVATAAAALLAAWWLVRTFSRGRSRPEPSSGPSAADDLKEHATS